MGQFQTRDHLPHMFWWYLPLDCSHHCRSKWLLRWMLCQTLPLLHFLGQLVHHSLQLWEKQGAFNIGSLNCVTYLHTYAWWFKTWPATSSQTCSGGISNKIVATVTGVSGGRVKSCTGHWNSSIGWIEQISTVNLCIEIINHHLVLCMLLYLCSLEHYQTSYR